MLDRLLAQRMMARAAVWSLAIGFVALAMLAILVLKADEAMTTRIREFNEISSRWTSAFDKVSAEASAVQEYVRTNGDKAARAELTIALGSANSDFEWIKNYGNAKEADYAQKVQIDYNNYYTTVRAILEVPDESKISDFRVLESLNYTLLRRHIVVNIERKQKELKKDIGRAKKSNENLRLITFFIVIFDLFFCGMSAYILVAYQRRAEEEADRSRYKAQHDTLTGLANRQLLADKIDYCVAESNRTNQSVGLLIIDLDKFKSINDTLGHHCGDLLLKQVARRLSGVVRKNDTVARLGGDEFAILLPGIPSSDVLLNIAEEVRKVIQQPVELNGLMVDFGASVGASIYPLDCHSPEDLLRHADVAMYVAKRGGFGVYVYNPSEDDHDPMMLSTLSELRYGIQNGELILVYQPKVSSVDRRILGVEALVRWMHPQRGLLSPDMFLSLIESGELIEQLTDEVLRMAVKQASEWIATGRRIPIAVNITVRSLLDITFPARLAEILNRFGLSSDLLTIELTESALIANPELAAKAVSRIRSLGAKVSIDDFGTGYSSMAFLRDMPVDELKIDRSFVTTMRIDSRNSVLVKSMVELARNLALTAVAEGVEDEDTFNSLYHLGCQVVQGFYISKPLSVKDMSSWLEQSYPVNF